MPNLHQIRRIVLSPPVVVEDEDPEPMTLPTRTADGAYVLDIDNDIVLYEDAADTQLDPASISKVVTMMLAVDNLGDLDAGTIVINAADVAAGSVLAVGDTMSYRNAMYYAGLPSDNGPINAVGRAIVTALGSSIGAHMNTKATALGATNSAFLNAHGGQQQNVSTPHDIARIMIGALAYSDIVSILTDNSQTVTITAGPNTGTPTITTTNQMHLEPGIGITKTGTASVTLKGSLATIWTSPTGEQVAAVYLGCDDSTVKFPEMRLLLQTYMLADWEWSGGVPRHCTTVKPQSLFKGSEAGHVFDPSDLRSLRTDTAGTTLVTADNDLVKRIYSLNHNSTIIVTEATNPPIYNLSGGLHDLTFDGSNDTISSSSTSAAQNRTYFSIMAAVNVVDSAVIRSVIQYRISAAASNRCAFELSAADLWVIGCRRLDADSLNTATGSTVQGAGKAIILAEYNYTASAGVRTSAQQAELSLWNGSAFVSEVTVAIAGTGNTSNTAGGMFIGNRAAATVWNGGIYAIVSEAREWTAQEVADLAAWMEVKAGL
jgi:hypothetical protein